MTIDELIQNFAKGLRKLVPEAECVGIPWKRPDAYDEWDSLAAATYETLVVAPLKGSLPEAARQGFRLPKYDLLIKSYAGQSLIEIVPEREQDTICIFHSLETEAKPFDSVEWRRISADDGRPQSDALEMSPLNEVTMRLRHVRNDGTVHHVTRIDVPEAPIEGSQLTRLSELDLDRERIRSLHALASSANSAFEKFVLSWIILNHFFIAHWERGHPPSEEPRDWDALKEFRRNPEVEAARTAILVHTGNKPVIKPVTRRGEPVLGGRGEVLAKSLDPNQFWNTLYAIRNNVIHGSKSPNGEVNEVNIEFAATQALRLVEELSRRAGVELQ